MTVGIAVLNDIQRQEIESKPIGKEVLLQWVDSTEALFQMKEADFWIDCTFSGTTIPFVEKPLLVHAPALTIGKMQPAPNVARFCAWATFLKRENWEVSVATGADATWLSELMHTIGWGIQLVKDEPGLIAPRMVCTIINEAYYTLQAGVSSAAEIDIAMKLGTNYPHGPLEWSRIIGLPQVHSLLQTLSEKNSIYKPAFTLH